MVQNDKEETFHKSTSKVVLLVHDVNLAPTLLQRGVALLTHSSKIRGLRSMKCSSETIPNLLYFMYKKTQVVSFVFHFVQLYFFPYECPGLCRHRPGHS